MSSRSRKFQHISAIHILEINLSRWYKTTNNFTTLRSMISICKLMKRIGWIKIGTRRPERQRRTGLKRSAILKLLSVQNKYIETQIKQRKQTIKQLYRFVLTMGWGISKRSAQAEGEGEDESRWHSTTLDTILLYPKWNFNDSKW